MEQVEFNNIQDIKFSNYFVDIDNLHKEDLTNINLLIKKYPYCQALHLLAARSAIGTPFYEKTLANAAVSVPSRSVLYNFIHHPEKFKVEKLKKSKIEQEIESETLISIIDDPASSLVKLDFDSATDDKKNAHDDEVFDEINSASIPDDEPLISIHHQPVFEISQIENLSLDGEKYSEILIADENIEEPKEQTSFPEEEIQEEKVSSENLAVEEIPDEVLSEQISEEKSESEEVETLDKEEEEEEEPETPIQEEETVSTEDLVIEEIPEDILSEETSESIQEKVEFSNDIEEFNDSVENVDVEENKNLEEKQSITIDTLPYIENIEDDEEDQEPEDSFIPFKDKEIEKLEEKAAVLSTPAHLPQVQQPVNLSRYDDERLPYTFLWWLAKTRKTYQENLRPYATFSLDTTQEIKKNDDEILEHQIAENIFHINSVSEIENKIEGFPTVAFDFMKKEHQIIEKFIKEEPQIKPPPANKIDTENKAKRSSEDSNELVSETLAKVYVEQMLFHKALDVYRKLSLKYPEKSAYFASQIKYLELKVN